MKWLEIQTNLRSAEGRLETTTHNLETESWAALDELISILARMEEWLQRCMDGDPSQIHTVQANVYLAMSGERTWKGSLAAALSSHSTIARQISDGTGCKYASERPSPKKGSRGQGGK